MPLNVTLASSLLEVEADQHRDAIKAGGRTFKTGIEALDRDLPGSLWRGGDIVGIGSDMSSGSGNKTDSLPLEIIVTHLLDGQANSPHQPASDTNPGNTKPSVFIVAPPTQATTSIQQIYTKLNTRILHNQQRPKHRSAPAVTTTTTIDTHLKSFLTRLSLLQYLDFSGLTESISEILTILTSTNSQPQPPQRTILLLQSLPQTLTTTHRRTGTLQTAALLTTLLQLLRNIARISGGTFLVLIEMDVSWTGGPGNTNTTFPSPTTMTASLPGLCTAFSSRSGKMLRVTSGPVFGRILEDGVDVLVVLHDGEGRVGRGQGRNQRVVECVRDERGEKRYGDDDADDGGGGVEDAFGAWTMWG